MRSIGFGEQESIICMAEMYYDKLYDLGDSQRLASSMMNWRSCAWGLEAWILSEGMHYLGEWDLMDSTGRLRSLILGAWQDS